MKFTKLLDWIKSKLVLSTLVKHNRLLVERFNKQRFNTLNFGLVFRNSKWTNYVKNNISGSQSRLFISIIKYLCLFVAFFLSSVILLGPSSTLSVLDSVWWQLKDLAVYAYLSTSLLVTWFFRKIHLLVLNQVAKTFLPESVYQIYLSNHSLIKGGVYGGVGDTLVSRSELFQSSDKTSLKFSNQTILLKNLFQVSNNIHKLNDREGITALKCILKKGLVFSDSLLLTSTDARLVSLKIWTDAVGNTSKVSNLTPNQVFTGRAWRLDHVLDDLTTSTNSFNILNDNENLATRKIATSRGVDSFFLTTTKLNSLVGVYRWLYRYNLLQNKNMVHASNLTSVKRLISFGSYTQDMLASNIWLSDTLAKSGSVRDQFVPFFRQTYGPYFSLKNYNTGVGKSYSFTTQTPSLEFSKYYESSYFWFLKRLYFLNFGGGVGVGSTPVSALSSVHHSGANLGTDTNSGNLLKALVTLRGVDEPLNGISTPVRDVFYYVPNGVLFDQTLLSLLYNISSTTTSTSTSTPYYHLSSNLLAIDSVCVDSVWYGDQDLSSLFGTQLPLSPAYIDLGSKRYAKDLHRFFHINS